MKATKTWEQKVDEEQRKLLAEGYDAIQSYEYAKARVNKPRRRRQRRAVKPEPIS